MTEIQVGCAKCALLTVLIVLSASQINHAQKSCFGNDVGAASTEYRGHDDWARKKDLAGIKYGLKWKIDALFNCPAVTDDDFFDAYAEISWIVAIYSDDSCCTSDKGILSKDKKLHRQWARNKGRHEALKALQYKVATALDCFGPIHLHTFYADVSVKLADAAVSPAF